MLRKTLLSLASMFAIAFPASSQSLSDIVTVEVLPGWRASDGTHMAALHMELASGWKTYWRAPGEAGIPPQFDWTASRNLAGLDVLWPTPRITVDHGMLTIGYSEQLVLPIRLLPARPGRDVTLRGTVEIGVCRDVSVTASINEKAKQTRDE